MINPVTNKMSNLISGKIFSGLNESVPKTRLLKQRGVCGFKNTHLFLYVHHVEHSLAFGMEKEEEGGISTTTHPIK